MLAIEDKALADKLDAKRKADAEKVLAKDKALAAELNK
jgi:phosphoribosylcarboxyaminoimidazole (NCAIR) mutase